MADQSGSGRAGAVLRASALAAIAGGALRVANGFTTNLLPGPTLALLYLVTDVLLLLGVAGIWWRRRPALGAAGHIGVGIFVVGILLIRVAAFGVLGAGGYQAGAAVALLGLVVYSVETLIRRNASLCPPVLWLVSLACGILGALGVARAFPTSAFPTSAFLSGAAGVTFGLGFVIAGIEGWRAPGVRG